MTKALGAFLAIVVLAACGTAYPSPSATASPSASPLASAGTSPGTSPATTPGPSGTLTEGDLRLAIADRFGPRWYCDPDEYPVAVADEQTRAIERFAEMQAEGVVFAAVVSRLGLAATTTFTDAQKLAIYRLWKVLISIPLDDIGGGRHRFDYAAQPLPAQLQGVRTVGTIGADGAIAIESQQPADAPNCPICLAVGTPIDGPAGGIPVDRLRLGDAIWTLDAQGRRVVGRVIALGSTAAPRDHGVIRLVLADARTVTASPGHPLADGRLVGEIRVGDTVDGSTVTAADSLRYEGGETFDLAVSGGTGVYFGGGIPLRSTLIGDSALSRS